MDSILSTETVVEEIPQLVKHGNNTGRYASVLGHTPRVLLELSQFREPLLHVIRHPSSVKSVAFSPDGSRLASGSDEIVRIWNTATGELEHALEGHTKWVLSVVFSHNGQFIVSGSQDKTVRIWNTATCETTHMLTGHTSDVLSVAIPSNDQFVVSGSYDRTVRTWDTATGELLRELKGHGYKVVSVAVSPDCQHIASLSGGEVWIWTKDGVIEHKLESPPNQHTHLYDLAFSHDGCRILCAYRMVWTTTGHRMDTDKDPGHLVDTRSVAYSPDDGEIVCGMEDGTVKIWKADTNETHQLGIHTYVVTSVAFSPDGSRIASGSEDTTVRIWDAMLRGSIDEEVSLKDLSRVALSHDGRWIVTASFGHIQVWRVTETITKANELSVGVCSLALSRDGSCVVIGCEGGSIWFWNHLTNTIECQITGHSKWVTCVAFSYDGSHVVSGSDDMAVRIWDSHTGNEVGRYQHSYEVTCVTFSHDGGRVAFGCDDGTVWIWSPSTGQIHSGPDNWSERGRRVYSVAFSHDGNFVISGRGDRVWIWNVTTNNKSAMSSERIQLPDGTRVHSLGIRDFHIYDPVDQKTTNGITPCLLSISPDRDWINGEQGEHNHWIPSQYRAFSKAHIAESVVCLQFDFGIVVLDLKSTPCAEHVMPGVSLTDSRGTRHSPSSPPLSSQVHPVLSAESTMVRSDFTRDPQTIRMSSSSQHPFFPKHDPVSSPSTSVLHVSPSTPLDGLIPSLLPRVHPVLSAAESTMVRYDFTQDPQTIRMSSSSHYPSVSVLHVSPSAPLDGLMSSPPPRVHPVLSTAESSMERYDSTRDPQTIRMSSSLHYPHFTSSPSIPLIPLHSSGCPSSPTPLVHPVLSAESTMVRYDFMRDPQTIRMSSSPQYPSFPSHEPALSPSASVLHVRCEATGHMITVHSRTNGAVTCLDLIEQLHRFFEEEIGREEWWGVRVGTKGSAMKKAYERRTGRAYSASARMKKVDYFLGQTMFKRIVPKYEDLTWLLQTC